jgi:hypothetical protein
MLPHGYELPAALLLMLGGALSCFAGYRTFRVVLGLYGFILGAMLASSMMAPSNAVGMVAAALVGGVVGALILMFAYFVGIALVGAGLGALLTHLAWNALKPSVDPPAVVVIAVSIFGAVIAMLLQRYVIIIGTAFGGAWTMLLGLGAAIAAQNGKAPQLGAAAKTLADDATFKGPWIFYPLSPVPGAQWVPIAWVALGVVGTAIQLFLTSRKK